MNKDVIIVGAGAAGLMCALWAGKRQRSVLVLDHADRIAKKVLISGGGRCNFTNTNISYKNYLSCNPHFCKSALARFTPHSFIDMMERHSLGYFEKEMGQLFCKEGSRAIVAMLKEECNGVGVDIRLNCRVADIKKEGRFILSTDRGMVQSESLVVATGGLSYPHLGATDFGQRMAKQFGLEVTALKPALVPFLFKAGDLEKFGELSGVSITAEVSGHDKHVRGEVLFTHRGLSGPAILQISSYWDKGDIITIDLLPDMNALDLFKKKRTSKIQMHNLLSEYLPKRFCRRWCELHLQSRPICQYNERELKEIAYRIHNWTVTPNGTEGYGKAEVTLGGVHTEELSSKTMEAKRVPGLFFIGEVIDVTGQLGGYNLQWAWASGYAAGQYA